MRYRDFSIQGAAIDDEIVEGFQLRIPEPPGRFGQIPCLVFHKMEDLIVADLIQIFLCVNCIEPVKQESIATDGSCFMVRLKIIFEQGYRFFRKHGAPPFC
jgi:hypothetical protein